ncbi:hypothetical protein SAMN02799616_02954 [Paenibacillus sp. UNC499MF]|nr:hypothetical protein SAMN02799616_02954 [Paenibacillus sp. UNC499MF]
MFMSRQRGAHSFFKRLKLAAAALVLLTAAGCSAPGSGSDGSVQQAGSPGGAVNEAGTGKAGKRFEFFLFMDFPDRSDTRRYRGDH